MAREFRKDIDYIMSHKMRLDDTFQFHCKACGKCCKNREDVLLTPYDLFRIARYLGRASAEIVDKYCDAYIGPDSHLPVVRIRPVPPDNSCPFLRNKKCIVHQDKPMVCAVYPLARIAQPGEPAPFYVLQPGNPCGGTDRTVTVRQWLGHLCSEEGEQTGMMWGELLALFVRALHFCWPQMPDEQKERFCSSLFVFLYLNYDVKEPFVPQMKANAMGAVILWQKELSFSEVPAWLPIGELPKGERQQHLLLLKAYGLYKREWCAARGLRPEQVNEETGVDGSCYACLEEFRDSEYQDASCMEALLEPGDFLLWKQYFQADRSCCHKSC